MRLHLPLCPRAVRRNPSLRTGLRLCSAVALLSLAPSCGPRESDLTPLPKPVDGQLYEYAVAVAERTLARVPEELRADALHALGKTYERFGRSDLALDLYSEATRLNVALADSYLATADILKVQGDRPQAALEALQSVLRYDWKRAGIFTSIGLLLSHSNRTEEALEAYEAEVRKGTADATTWYLLGHGRSSLGRHEAAVTAYEKALELDPQHRETLHGIAQSCKTLARGDEAAEYEKRFEAVRERDFSLGLDERAPFEDAEAQRSRVAETWRDAAFLYLRAHNLAAKAGSKSAADRWSARTVTACERSLEFDPELEAVHRLLFEIESKRGTRATQLRIAEAWRAAAPASIDASNEVAQLHLQAISGPEAAKLAPSERAHAVTTARACLEKVLEAIPDQAAAHHQLAELLLFEIRRPDLVPAGLRHAQRALELSKAPTPRLYDVLAYAQHQSGDLQAVVETLRAGVAKFPQDASLKKRLEQFLRSRGNSAAAGR